MKLEEQIVTRTVREKSIDHLATGVLFRQMRERSGLSLRAVADRLGLSAPYIGDLELGRRNWTEELFNRAKAALKQ